MSLFEKIQNKRYDLQEENKKSFPSGSFDAANQETQFVKNEKNKRLTNKEISARRSAETTRGDAINRAIGGTSSTEGTGGANNSGTTTYTPPSKKKVREIMNRSTAKKLNQGQMPNISSPKITGDVTPTEKVKQSEVSKQAKEFTKKVNKQNKNLTPKKFFDPVKAKKAKDNLIAKRKEYGIDRKGNISDDGVKRYAQKTKQLSSGSNVPAKVTSKDLKIAKIRAVGGEKVKDSTGKVVGTTTGKYGGKLSRARNKNLPSYADVKANIDAKEKVKNMTKKPKTVLKVTQPGSKFRASKEFPGFDVVPSSKGEGKKILQKQVTTDELLGRPRKIEKELSKKKKIVKPSLWSRTKSKLKDIHNWMKSDYRKTSGKGITKNITRNTYKNTLRGNTIRNINKVLPGKYKVLAAIATGAYLYSRGNKKDAGAAAGGGPTKYYGANPKLKLDMKGSPPPPKAKESKK